MADVSVTAANVVAVAGSNIIDGTLGATITAGQSLYYDTTAGTYKLADANASAATGSLDGIALTGGSSGQPVKILTDGNYNPGGTVVVGTIYVLSATAGAICPAADLASGHYVNVLGVGTTASNIKVTRCKSGVAVP